MMTALVQEPIRILRFSAVAERTGETKSQIYAKMARDEFPKPVKLSPRCVGWVEAELDLYLKQKVEMRDRALAEEAKRRERVRSRRAA